MKKNKFKIPRVLSPLAEAFKDETDRRVKLCKGEKINKNQLKKEIICDFIGHIFMEDLSIERFIKILTNEKLYKKYI